MELVVAEEDPRRDDVRSLLVVHLEFSHAVTPPGHVHALGVDGLVDPSITVFAARDRGLLLGVGALRELDPSHGELKSMHTVASARGLGVGRAVVRHVVRVARERGYERVSLETGTYDAFAPARALYASMGFTPCEPFPDHTSNPHSTCMTLVLVPDA